MTNRFAICHSYRCPIETEALSSIVFEVFGPKSRARTYADIQTHRHTLQVIYILSHAVYCTGQTKINIKNTDYNSAHETSGVPNNAIRLYACIRRQTTRLRNMNADISRSLLQSKNSSRPTLLSTFSVCHRRPIIGLLVLLR